MKPKIIINNAYKQEDKYVIFLKDKGYWNSGERKFEEYACGHNFTCWHGNLQLLIKNYCKNNDVPKRGSYSCFDFEVYIPC